MNFLNGDWCPNALNIYHHVKSKIDMIALTKKSRASPMLSRRGLVIDKTKLGKASPGGRSRGKSPQQASASPTLSIANE